MAEQNLPKQVENKVFALIYDFDNTLIEGNLPDHSLLEEIGWEPEEFWKVSNKRAEDQRADMVCVYMHTLLEKAEEAGKPITREMLERHGKKIKMREGFADGQNSWFKRTGEIAREHGLEIQHYVITSGLAEMVEACPIANDLRAVFGSRYLYDENGKAVGLAHVVNYTNKTQHLFRINKGVHDIADDRKLNEYMHEETRPVPFSNMLFIGDGFTDIPCFSLIKRFQGHTLAVLANEVTTEDSDIEIAQHIMSKINKSFDQIETLVSDGRADHISLGAHFVPDGRVEQVVEKVARAIEDNDNR